MTPNPVPVTRFVDHAGAEAWFLGQTMLVGVDTPAHVDATLGELGADRCDLAFPPMPRSTRRSRADSAD